MKVLGIKVLRGPNYWSINRRHLIQMELDIEQYEELPTSKIPGFTDRLVSLIPSLYTHRCSEGSPGGFISRMQEGTWLGHVIEHVALELQSLAGMECGFGRTRSTGSAGVYHVVFSYLIANAGVYAAHAAVRLVEAVARGEEYDLATDIARLEAIYYEEKLGPSTQAIVDEAARRGIPYRRLDEDSLVMLGQGAHQKIIRATIAGNTSNIAVELAQDKQEVKRLLEDAFLPVPAGTVVDSHEQLVKAIKGVGFPMVVKPVDGNHGRGVTTHIDSEAAAFLAFDLAKKISDKVIVERFIDGYDFRLLVINYKLVAVAKRTPAHVRGNGHSTIRELIEMENQNPNRGEGHGKVLTKITIDEDTIETLAQRFLSLDSVLPFGAIAYLKSTANLSSGGTAENVTDLVHPHNAFLAERAARLLGLNICGIDLIAADISKPITSENGAFIEMNAAPGFRMHQYPTKGEPVHVAAPVVDMLFPEGAPCRIPIVAVTGTNGKTTTTRLVAHIAQKAGKMVGYTNTDGIWLNDHRIAEGDCSGPASAEAVLRDPLVDFAVLECARGGMLRAGLGFDRCNISIVTNVSEDHLGLGGIQTLEDLARVKRIVPESTFDDGFAILNADDELVYNMREHLDCNIALFSLDAANPRIAAHVAQGGLAAWLEDGWLVLSGNGAVTRLIQAAQAPVTLGGKSNCMIQNALAAALAARASGFDDRVVAAGLSSFVLSPELNPGRMNIFDFEDFSLIVDYAHNVGGYSELKSFIEKTEATHKTGIIAGTGDRRDQDIISLGAMAAAMFDEIIIRHDKDGRGRTNEEISFLLLSGIKSKAPDKKVTIISDELEALQFAMDNAPYGALIFLCSDEIQATLQYIEEVKKADQFKQAVRYGS